MSLEFVYAHAGERGGGMAMNHPVEWPRQGADCHGGIFRLRRVQLSGTTEGNFLPEEGERREDAPGHVFGP